MEICRAQAQHHKQVLFVASETSFPKKKTQFRVRGKKKLGHGVVMRRAPIHRDVGLPSNGRTFPDGGRRVRP